MILTKNNANVVGAMYRDFIDPILDYLARLARVPRLWGVLGPCSDDQYSRIILALTLIQDMSYFQVSVNFKLLWR